MLKRKYRVGREDFAEVMKNGGKISTDPFFVRYKKNTNSKAPFRCSVIVSKKIASKAVDRNNFRRRVYNAINEAIKTLPANTKIGTVLFFVKCDLRKIVFDVLKSNVVKIFETITSLPD